MKRVIQEEISGCGIASVAALAGVSYAHAKRTANSMGIFAEDKELWSDTEYVRKLLQKYGIEASNREIPFRSWEELPDLALLAIKWHKENGKPLWHWVVYVREGKASYVLDPKKALKTDRRTDFGRMSPKWYIEIFT